MLSVFEAYMGCTELVPVESQWHEYKQVSTSVTNVRKDNYICTADTSCWQSDLYTEYWKQGDKFSAT